MTLPLPLASALAANLSIDADYEVGISVSPTPLIRYLLKGEHSSSSQHLKNGTSKGMTYKAPIRMLFF